MLPGSPTGAGRGSGFQTYKTNVKLGAGQKLGFTAGRGYYARTAPVQQNHPGGGSYPGQGLQPLTGAQIANEIAGYTNSLPAPLTDQQIQQRAQELISPIVQAITGQITSAEQAGAGAISGYSQQLARNLAGLQPEVASIYAGAQQAQAAANAAEAQATSGQGTQLAGQVAAQIGQMQGPAGLQGAVVAPVAQTGSGAAAAMLGTGSAFLDKLIAEGANANVLAAKQPGFALAQGQQDLTNLGLSSQKQLADALSKEQEQVPGLVQNLETQSAGYRTNRATAAEKLREYLTARNDALSLGQQKNETAVTVANTKAAATAYAARVKAGSAKEAAQAKAAETSFKNRLAFAKAYGYDPVTGATLPGYSRNGQGQVVKAAKPGSVKGQLTDNEAAKLVQQWHDGKATSVTTPVVDPKTGKQAVSQTTGKPLTETKTVAAGTLKYGQAYAMLRQFGKTDARARKLLDTVYAKGDSGRAWVTNEEQHALQAAGVPYKAKTVKDAKGNTRGLLGPRQYQTLKKAGLVPPGQLTAEGWYVIAPVN